MITRQNKVDGAKRRAQTLAHLKGLRPMAKSKADQAQFFAKQCTQRLADMDRRIEHLQKWNQRDHAEGLL